MPALILRDLDSTMYSKVKAKAALENKTLRSVVIDLLEKYATSPPETDLLNDLNSPVTGKVSKKGLRN